MALSNLHKEKSHRLSETEFGEQKPIEYRSGTHGISEPHIVSPFSHFLREETDRFPETGKRPKKYHNYENSFKIAYLKLASEIGSKRASIHMKIPWSTARSWTQKDERAKQDDDTYSNQLTGKELFSLDFA